MQLGGELRFAADGVGLAALLGQVLADAQPQVAVGGLLAGHRVVGHGHAGHLDDAGLDGVDQREVGDHPGKERAFGVAGAAQEERRGREVVDGLHADLGLHGLEAGNPDAGLFVALLGFDAVVAGELLVLAVGLAAVAVVGLVVDDDDVLLVAQLAADAAHHLVGRFGERRLVCPSARIDLVSLPAATFSRSWKAWKLVMRILAWPSWSMQLGRDDVALAVVVLRVVGQQHAQPVADGDAGRDDQEGVGEAGVLRVGELVERVPGDEHGHDDGLAGAGGHLEGRARQAGVRGVVRLAERVLDPGIAVLLGDLGDVDGGFEGFDLAEEELLLAVGVGPVGEQAGGGGRHADVAALAATVRRGGGCR